MATVIEDALDNCRVPPVNPCHESAYATMQPLYRLRFFAHLTRMSVWVLKVKPRVETRTDGEAATPKQSMVDLPYLRI